VSVLGHEFAARTSEMQGSPHLWRRGWPMIPWPTLFGHRLYCGYAGRLREGPEGDGLGDGFVQRNVEAREGAVKGLRKTA
jgi:hypothetical protein